MSHECYYCDQFFLSKEKLFDHLEVHSDTQQNQKTKNKEKTVKKRLMKTLKKNASHTRKISDD